MDGKSTIKQSLGMELTKDKVNVGVPELIEIYNTDEQLKKIMDMAIKVEGLPRNTSMHAAGVVICEKPIMENVPLQRNDEDITTQFDMIEVEALGMLKMDFLGLRTLTDVQLACKYVYENFGIDIDFHKLGYEDAGTYELIGSGETDGVFQLESPGMKRFMRDLKPSTFEDIIAGISLYRPGPMDSIPQYIKNKHNPQLVTYDHPLLEPILKNSYGILVYQEQVMQICQSLGGFTLGHADVVRKAMGKKKVEIMEAQKAIFVYGGINESTGQPVDGAIKRGVPEDVAIKVYDNMKPFARYAFNKSHAAAYAYIAYQTAFLKAHYPVEFMAATMTLDKTNTDKLAFFKNDLTQMHIEVLPPDINKSVVNFSVENGAVRYALSAVRNVGEAGMQLVVAEREKNGPFKSVQDFFSRVDASALNKRYIENLIKSGAFDCLDKNRAKLFENIENFLAFASNATQSRKSAQINLFGATDTAANGLKMRDYPDWPHLEKLEKEAEAIGFYLSAHPLDTFDSVFERLRVIPSTEVKQQVTVAGSVRVQLAGIVSSVRERISQKGNKFAFVTATDKYGSYDAICFSDLLLSSREKLKSGQPLLLTMSADKKPDDEQIRMNLLAVDYLSEVMARTASCLILDLEGGLETVQELKKILSQDEPGRCKIFLRMQVKDYELEVELAEKYALSQKTLEALQHLSGIGEIKQV